MRKSDLFASNSHYAFGAMGLSHYKVTQDREHMVGLVEKAEASPYETSESFKRMNGRKING